MISNPAWTWHLFSSASILSIWSVLGGLCGDLVASWFLLRIGWALRGLTLEASCEWIVEPCLFLTEKGLIILIILALGDLVFSAGLRCDNGAQPLNTRKRDRELRDYLLWKGKDPVHHWDEVLWNPESKARYHHFWLAIESQFPLPWLHCSPKCASLFVVWVNMLHWLQSPVLLEEMGCENIGMWLLSEI